jgi:hypothetical protein
MNRKQSFFATIILIVLVSCRSEQAPDLNIIANWRVREVTVRIQDSATNGSLIDTFFIEYSAPRYSNDTTNQHNWNFGNKLIIITRNNGFVTQKTYSYKIENPYDTSTLIVYLDESDSTRTRKYHLDLGLEGQEYTQICDLEQFPVYTRSTFNGVAITLKTVNKIELEKDFWTK